MKSSPSNCLMALPLVLTACLAMPSLSQIVAATEATIAGYVENAWFDDKSIAFKAKLDTGAKSSSINAFDFKKFTKDGQDWVRFTLTNQSGQSLEIERPILRQVRIRRSGVGVRERPAILLEVCVAGHAAEVEFNLSNRQDMNYQVLIGRTFLSGRVLVDSGKSFIASGRCGRG